MRVIVNYFFLPCNSNFFQKNLGGFTDNGSEFQKTYLASRYAKSSWFKAKSICKSFDLELVSFETLNEAQVFLDICKNNEFIKSLGSPYIHVDGMTQTPHSPTEWYWTNSGRKVSFRIPWQNGQPDFDGDEYCLSVVANEGFNDLPCETYIGSFICQRLDYFSQARELA